VLEQRTVARGYAVNTRQRHPLLCCLIIAVTVAYWTVAIPAMYRYTDGDRWSSEEYGVSFRLVRSLEGWHFSEIPHALEFPATHVLCRARTRLGLAAVTVALLQLGSHPSVQALAEAIERERGRRFQGVQLFWKSDLSSAWRFDRSFRGQEGLRTIKYITRSWGPFGVQYLQFDHYVRVDDSTVLHVSAFVPRFLFRYYEMDLKYILASFRLLSRRGGSR